MNNNVKSDVPQVATRPDLGHDKTKVMMSATFALYFSWRKV